MAGSITLVLLLGATPPTYPSPFDQISYLLSGARLLLDTVPGFTSVGTVVPYVLSWLLIGVIASIFSTRGWNTVRTLLWSSLVSGLLVVISEALLNDFWNSPSRNLDLVVLFGQMATFSMIALLTAYPLTLIKEMALRKSEDPIPDRVETTCECGAVFRSNPLICSECGRILREKSTDPA